MNEESGPQIGDVAPDFTLPSTSGQSVTLSSFRGESNVLLAFFPLAFTGTCTAELLDFSKDLDHFDELNAQIFGISVDAIPSLVEFKAKYELAVDLLSDFKREVSRSYGTLLDELFFSNRSYFLIDTQGVLRWSHTEDDLSGKRDNQELLKQLRELD